MAADLYRSALVQQTRASLDALEQAVRSEPRIGAESVALLLERWGDALRLSEPVPVVLRSAAGQIGLTQLGETLARRTEEVKAWIAPGPSTEPTDEDLVFVLCRRDETESLLQALTRLLLERRELPADVSGIEALSEALAAFDRAVAASVDRRRAESALGIRVALHDGATWLDVLRSPEVTGVAEATQDRYGTTELDELEGSAPSDTIVDRYIRRGVMRAYVETHAERDPEFAADLADAIDQMREIGVPVSLMAGAWRMRQKERPTKSHPFRYPFAADRREAAASDSEVRLELQRHELGPLPGVAAEAALERRGGELALIVYPERMLQRVAFGEAECGGPDAEGNWVVRLASSEPSAELRVVVVDDTGRRFEETLHIELR